MSRLLFLALVVILGCKLLTGRWPWDLMQVQSARRREIDHARRLLSVRAGASRSEIVDAHRRLVGLVHPDRGGTNEQMQEANTARDLLLGELPEGR